MIKFITIFTMVAGAMFNAGVAIFTYSNGDFHLTTVNIFSAAICAGSAAIMATSS
jgi:hypothetical protein